MKEHGRGMLKINKDLIFNLFYVDSDIGINEKMIINDNTISINTKNKYKVGLSDLYF